MQKNNVTDKSKNSHWWNIGLKSIISAHADGGPRSFSLIEQVGGINLLETPNRKTNNLILYTKTDRNLFLLQGPYEGWLYFHLTNPQCHDLCTQAHKA